MLEFLTFMCVKFMSPPIKDMYEQYLEETFEYIKDDMSLIVLLEIKLSKGKIDEALDFIIRSINTFS